MSDQDLQQGQMIPVANRPVRIGKYEITDVIGEGGMGAVYKATDPRIGRTVAIKVIKGDFSDNPELLKRFYREAQAVGNLQHPNIVVVYDLGEENGSPYLVMEYLNGIPLDKVIAQRQSVPVVQKLGIVIEVLNALHYAHQHNIVHRDVKPANVMVLRDGKVKLLDFGIAREGDLGQTKTGQVMGTMWYMSPEQLNSEAVDGRSDVYATGILLYEFLAYTLPFDPRDMTGMIVKRLRGDPTPPLSKYLESYPLELDEIIARALTVDREQRFSSAEEFAFDLSRLQERLKRDMVSHFVDEARAFIAKSELTRAKDLLSQVLQIDTQNPTAKQLLYEIQQTLQKAARGEKVHELRARAEEAISAKQWEQADNLLDQAIKLDSTDPDLLSLRAQIERAKSRAQQVKKLLTLAKVAQQTGELVVAKRAVDDALVLDPQDTDARMMQSAIARQLVEYEKQRQVQQFLEAARREIAAHQFAAARENVDKAKAIDQAYPEIPGLERMLKAGLDQETRQRELLQVCSQIEQELNANHPKAARDIAAKAMRKFPGEPDMVRLKAAAEAAIERAERRLYIDDRIATASRLIDGGEATRALRLLKDIEREYPTDLRLREYLEVVRQTAARENAAREKAQFLQKARDAMRSKSFAQAISVLDGGLVQFPEDAEIKDLLNAAREEFERLEKKKQVEEVSKQAQSLLHARAHTDAIRLLERTAAQISDAELTSLLQYAREEAAKFHAAAHQASEQAAQMLSLGQHSEAVTFLEAQVDKYGRNADFQVLLEQARKQAEEARRAKERLRSTLQDARAKLKAQDIQAAEALLHVCEIDAPDEPDVMALAIELQEEKKAQKRRQDEATARAAREKKEAERRQAEDERRALQARQEEERRRREAEERELRQQKEAAERELQKQREAAEAAAPPLSTEREAATILDVPGAQAASPAADLPPVAAASPLEEGAPLSLATDIFRTPVEPERAEAIGQTAVDLPARKISEPPKVPGKKTEPKKKARSIEASPAAETVVTPIPPKPAEVAPRGMEPLVEEPKPAPRPSTPPPLEPPPPEVRPPGNKRLLVMIGGAIALILLVIALVFFLHSSKQPMPVANKEVPPAVVPQPAQPPQPTSALLKIVAPPGAKFRLGDISKTIGPDGTAEIETRPGKYQFEINAQDFKPYSAKVELKLGQNEPLTPPLEPLHAEKFGTLLVRANVDHFDVLVDGQLKSNSGGGKQAKLKILQGTYKVQVKKSGYVDSAPQSIDIVANKDNRTPLFDLKLTPPTEATLSVTLHPAGNIRIDDGSPIPVPNGSYTGKLSPGSHKVEASADGYQTKTKELTAKAGETVPLAFDLPIIPVAKPQPAITVSAVPDNIEQGKSATIRWNAQNATQVTIAGFPGRSFDPNGQIDVTPDKDTTYTLIAKGPGGEKMERVKISVRAKVTPPPPPAARDEKPFILAAIKAWSSAYESKDGQKIKEAFPTISQNFEKGIRAIPTAINVVYQCGDPKITGNNTAEASCTESVAVVGGPPPRPRHVSVQLAKNGEKWTVSAIAGSK